MADDKKRREGKETNSQCSSERKRHRSRSCSKDKDIKKEKRSDKKKSRKRSYSDSESSKSSSSSSRESDKKKLEKKVRKRKKRRTSSESSSSESDNEHSTSKSRNKHKKQKLKKLSFKEEKLKKKKKKKERKGSQHGAIDQNKYGKYGIIRESDMFVKQQEFYSWLQEVKNTNPETLPKFETRKMFETYMEDYNTATLPHKKYYDLEKWETKRQQKNQLKVLKKARESSFSIMDDEKRHEMLHRKVGNKYAGPSRQQLLEMQQELRRRQDEEYRKKAGLS